MTTILGAVSPKERGYIKYMTNGGPGSNPYLGQGQRLECLLSKLWVLTIIERNIINGYGYKQTMTPFLGISSPKEWDTPNRQHTRDQGLHSTRLRNLGQDQGLKHGSPEYLSLYKGNKNGFGVATLTPIFGVISQKEQDDR